MDPQRPVLSPDGNLVAVLHGAKAVRLYDAASGQLKHELTAPPAPGGGDESWISVAFIRGSKELAIGVYSQKRGNQMGIYRRDCATGKALGPLMPLAARPSGGAGGMPFLQADAEGKLLAVADTANVSVRDVETNKELWASPTHSRTTCFSSDGKLLAATSDTAVNVCNSQTGDTVSSTASGTSLNALAGLAFIDQNRALVTACGNGLRLLDPVAGRTASGMGAHDAGLQSGPGAGRVYPGFPCGPGGDAATVGPGPRNGPPAPR